MILFNKIFEILLNESKFSSIESIDELNSNQYTEISLELIESLKLQAKVQQSWKKKQFIEGKLKTANIFKLFLKLFLKTKKPFFTKFAFFPEFNGNLFEISDLDSKNNSKLMRRSFELYFFDVLYDKTNFIEYIFIILFKMIPQDLKKDCLAII